MFEVGVGTSRSWDPDTVAREAIANGLKGLSHPPKIVLFFSTIHYQKNNGFKKIINLVYDSCPALTQLAGCTVGGFISREGCYAHGIALVFIYSDEVDFSISIGKNSKRSPRTAVKQVLGKLPPSLKKRGDNNFLLLMISGGKVPYIPFLKQGRVVHSNIIGEIESKAINLTLKIIQKGVGREEEILQSITKELPDATIMSMSSMDDEKMNVNYQFVNRDVLTDIIVGVSFSTTVPVSLESNVTLEDTGVEFNITKIGKDKRTIKELDGIPAKEAFIKSMKWPKAYFDENIYRKVFFYPLVHVRDGVSIPSVAGLFLGQNIYSTYQIESDKLKVMSYSGKKLAEAINSDTKKAYKENPKFVFVIECGIRLEAMGRKIFSIRESILRNLGPVPFLLVYAAGEGAYSKHKLQYGNETYNRVSFFEGKK